MIQAKTLAPPDPRDALARLTTLPDGRPTDERLRPEPRRRRTALAGPGALAALGLSALVGLAGAVQARLAHSRLSARIVGTGEALLQVMEDLLIEEPELLRTEVLQPLVGRFDLAHSFVQRVSVIDRSLRVVADTDPARVGQLTDQRSLAELLHRREDRRADYLVSGRRIVRLSRPLYGAYDQATGSHIFGAMSLDLQLGPADGALARETRGSVALLALLGGVLFGWLCWVIPRRYVAPLERLAEAIERFGRGEESARAASGGDPAVAAAAEAFNRAADRIRREDGALREQVQAAAKNEARLRASEERFKALVESNVIGLVVAEIGGRLIEANEAFLKLAGYGRQDLQAGQLSWPLMTPPEYQPLDELAVTKLKAAGACPPWEKELIRKDGRRVPVLVGVARVGEATDRYICFILDLTERRKAEDVLARLAAIVESSEDAIIGMSLDGTIISWNAGAEAMYGYAASELSGRPVSMIAPTELAAETAELLERVKRGEAIAHHETVRVKRSGARFEVSLSISPIRDAVGWVVGASSIARDITERKRAEAKIRQLNEQLEQQLLQVTSVNKELEAFSYSVSHDLRAPLRSIDGFSQALLEDCAGRLDADGKDYLRRIREASQRMGALIDDMLQLARVTRGELKREPVDLSGLVRGLADELRARAPERPVEFVVAGGLAATGDGSLLRAVLQNLMENAWKFTSKRPDARIEFGAQERDGQRVYVVRDNGAGFDIAQAGRLFTAFQRLHAQTEFPGTGIGLATVQRIIHRHGGRIWAEGALGKGAAFFFTLG